MPADVVAIAAMAENRVIGSDGDLPWDGYEADLERFKRLTMGHPVILGRVTYESIVDSIGGPLPGRKNIVVSTTEHYKDEWTRTVNSPGSAITLALRIDDKAYIAGGASIYDTLVPLATSILLTIVPEEPDGDAYFPEIDEGEWTLVSSETGPNGLIFKEYERLDVRDR